MAHDYKPRQRRTPSKKTQNSGRRRSFLPAFLVGLVPGLLIALLIYLTVHTEKLESPTPSQVAAQPASSRGKTETATPSTTTKSGATASGTATNAHPANPHEPQIDPEPAETERPRFEFYTILPGREVMIPDTEIDSATSTAHQTTPTRTATTATTDTTSTPGSTTPTPADSARPSTPAEEAQAAHEYVLQAGSFQSYADADRLKARIALLGIMATIQSVVIKQGEQWHRVRIGPVDSMAELNRIRTRLADNKIKVLVIQQTPQNR